MAKREYRTVTYECDRCGFELDGKEVWQEEARLCGPSPLEFWVAKAMPEHRRLTMGDVSMPYTWLCAECVRQYVRFMDGRQLVGEGD